ncbi:reverse transcriptase domain-containing protein [Tanacetum coccineum]
MDDFCREKGIKREYSVARTPQQNGVAERKNRTLIEAARTMLADSKLPTTFWAEAVSTACYVQNRVLIVKPHNKTPYELFRGKFDGKSDEGFFVGYSLSSKAFRVYNIRTRKVQENLHIGFLENKPMIEGNGIQGVSESKKSHDDSSLKDNGTADQQVNTARQEINPGSREVSTALPEVNTATPEDLVGPIPASEDTQVEDQEIELGNISTILSVRPLLNRIHKDHPIEHVIGDVQSFVQTRRMKTSYSEQGFLSAIYEGKSHQDLHTCLFACFLSQEEPKRVSKALSDPTWVEAMQEELLQFKLQKVWILVDLPKGHRAIGTNSNRKRKAFFPVKINMSMNFEKVQLHNVKSPLLTPDLESHWFKMEMPEVMNIFIDHDISVDYLISHPCQISYLQYVHVQEYEAAASLLCTGLWLQNQLLDYGYNFMNTVIYIDNNSTICIIENPVQHSKTKHIEIRHHFIRDCSSSDHSLPTPSSSMRPSQHLCLLVPSIPCSSAAISDRPSHDSSSASPSRKRSRSTTASLPLYLPILGALSYARADLLPSPKRIRSSEFATDLEVSSVEDSEPSRYRGTDLEMDVDVVMSDGIDIDPKIQAEIDECIAYADALRDRGIDARVVVEAVDREEIETGMRGPVEVRVDKVTHPVIADDIPEPAQEGAVEVTYETLGDLVQRIVATGHQSVDMLERIEELERDNMRLRDMMDVASQRVARSQRRELRVQREMRQIRHFRFYNRMRIARLEACARRHLGYRS